MTASFHFVVVPGAWHQPEAYEKLAHVLRNLGHSAVAPRLPSCEAPEPEKATCSGDAEAVRRQILESIDTVDKDIVVVAHSYGGIPAGGATYGLGKIARAKEGKIGGVVGLVYVSGFIVPENMSLLQIMGGTHAPYVEPNQPSHNLCTIKDPRNVLFNDLNDGEAERLAKLLRPTSMHAFDSPAPSMAWAEPEFADKLGFVRCLQDRALPPFVQDKFVESSGVKWDVKDIEASHSPFASKPDDLAELLEGFARSFES